MNRNKWGKRDRGITLNAAADFFMFGTPTGSALILESYIAFVIGFVILHHAHGLAFRLGHTIAVGVI